MHKNRESRSEGRKQEYENKEIKSKKNKPVRNASFLTLLISSRSKSRAILGESKLLQKIQTCENRTRITSTKRFHKFVDEEDFFPARVPRGNERGSLLNFDGTE